MRYLSHASITKALPFYTGILIVLLATCAPKENPSPSPTPVEPEQQDASFSVELSISDGILVDGKVFTHPVVEFTLHSTDEAANYSIRYRIDGGTEKIVSGLWDGRSRDISADFAGFATYGAHSLSGYVFPDGDELNRFSFDETVWIRHEDVSVSRICFSSVFGDIPFDSAKLNSGETGLLKVEFSPASRIDVFSVVSDNPDILSFDTSKAQLTAGLFSVPYRTASTPGTASVILRIENGRSTDIRRSIVTTDAGRAFSAELSVSVPQLVFTGKSFSIPVNISAPGMDLSGRTFILKHVIDGKTVSEQHSVTLPFSDRFTTSVSEVGTHSYSVTLESADFIIDNASASGSFTAASPIVTIKEGSSAQAVVLSTSTPATVRCGKQYTISVEGVPASLLSLLSLSGVTDKDSFTGKSPWTYTPKGTGEGSLKLSVSGQSYSLSYPLKRTDKIALTISRGKRSNEDIYGGHKYYAVINESGAASSVKIKASVTHCGRAEWWYNNYDGSGDSDYSVISSNTVKSAAVTVTKGAAQSLVIDLSSEEIGYNSQKYNYSTYSDEGFGWERYYDYEIYHTYVNSISFEVSTSTGGAFDAYTEVACTVDDSVNIQPISYHYTSNVIQSVTTTIKK